jgi:hypothetical protein
MAANPLAFDANPANMQVLERTVPYEDPAAQYLKDFKNMGRA